MDKASLRAQFLKRRQVLTPDEVRQESGKIAERLSRLLAQKPPHYLHIFLPHVVRNEIDTRLIGEVVRAEFPEVQLVVPRVVPGTRTLEHYLYTPQTPLLTNRWGIPEPDPQAAQPIAPEELDAVLVPLLAFDRQGYRVGYGGGYYDRFLPQCRPGALKIGLSFFEPVPAIDDIDGYDIRLDYCLTPNHTWRWQGRE
ncbi:5-formyltetrahydrofolate cyclo-ligase [Telluribacter sp.]|jgi:5-formyltetrahydrofolate cyclo-ligase|uniref:5-formyltetrahydrofolate cyclo-ligase n=1 Tax=Telluribacter sp. TaxID=1978767 RepID=UPI002E0D68E4|nr:5-formyltetrahydrofolate cyclo-ligase [Telluribacter sp.]